MSSIDPGVSSTAPANAVAGPAVLDEASNLGLGGPAEDGALGTEHRPLRLDPGARERVLAEGGASVLACFQCAKCSAGCPVAEFTDLLPHRIIRLAQLGQRGELLGSGHIWVCTGCGTCTSRCPNGVDVAGLMDRLKAASIRAGATPGARKAAEFHALFNRSVLRFGRSHELGVIRRLKTAGELLADLGLGWKLLRRGKMRLRAQRVKARGEIRELFRLAEEADR